MAAVKIKILTRAIVKTTLKAHLNHVVYSTLASVRPPIMAPQVGVIKLTSPFAATNVMIVVSRLYPTFTASGPIIGVDSVARPELDGTNIDKTTCNK